MEVFPARTNHRRTVMFLHGRDSSATEFANEFFESQTSDERTLQDIFPETEWVFPTAKVIRAARFGVEMSQWFDMWSTENPHERDEEQQETMSHSIAAVLNTIEQEVSIVGAKNVVLAGISQGCAIAVHAVMRQQEPLGGFIGLSSWLAAKPSLPKTSACETPVFLAHCQDDDVIKSKYGEELRSRLVEMGNDVGHSYEDGGHWVNEPRGINDMVAFLRRNLIAA